jgi:hypothetical protein
VRRAMRDHSPVIALYTTPMMTVALSMYLRMGFTKLRNAEDIYGVPYAVYTKELAAGFAIESLQRCRCRGA